MTGRCGSRRVLTLAGIVMAALGAIVSSARGENNPEPLPAVKFILDKFEQYPSVAIGGLPQCEQLHAILKSLVQDPTFSGKVNDIVVEFGNPRYQRLVDRYVVNSEDIPRLELRRVWDDSTEAVTLTWDSPLYEEFFTTIRTVNWSLPKKNKIHVVLGGVPIDWENIHSKKDLLVFTKQKRADALAEKVKASLGQGHRVLVIGSETILIRTGRAHRQPAAVESVQKTHPGKVYVIAMQGRFGTDATYKDVEMKEGTWPEASVIPVKGTWFEPLAVDQTLRSPQLRTVADAVLYLGPSDSLTALRPPASIFRDDEYFSELNRRWRIVNGSPITPTTWLFDLRQPLLPENKALRAQYEQRFTQLLTVGTSSPNPSTAIDGADFVIRTLDRYPIVGIGEIHRSVEFHAFLRRLVRDPRLPDKINDILVEFGNPTYQSIIDRYVVDGEDVPRDERRKAWERAAMGCYVSCTPVYEQFYDTVREVNLKLPRSKRMRIILADSPFDPFNIDKYIAADPQFLQKMGTVKETAKDPREIALSGSVNGVLEKGHRGIMICGYGHLQREDQGGQPGNARSLIEKQHPGKFYLVDPASQASAIPVESIAVRGDALAELYLGPLESLSVVLISPLLYREKDLWEGITRFLKLTSNKTPLAPGNSVQEFSDVYRQRYFEKPLPSGAEAAPGQWRE